ncbi:hypothetical protein K438DRAFT_1782215 [Mycena galopus ATCC 62051]|nr:hypothetical protein K438DRAFT_1782215 [Mycena galopus ATCC 62051]
MCHDPPAPKMPQASFDADDAFGPRQIRTRNASSSLLSSSLALPFPSIFMASPNYTTPNGNKCTVCKTQLEVRFAKGGKVPGSHYLRWENHQVEGQIYFHRFAMPQAPTPTPSASAYAKCPGTAIGCNSGPTKFRQLDKLYGVKSPSPETREREQREDDEIALVICLSLAQPHSRPASQSSSTRPSLWLPISITETGHLRSLSPSPDLPEPSMLLPSSSRVSSSSSSSLFPPLSLAPGRAAAPGTTTKPKEPLKMRRQLNDDWAQISPGIKQKGYDYMNEIYMNRPTNRERERDSW